MSVFSIGGTDFAVDGSKSRIRLEAVGNGMLELDADIHGDAAVFADLTDEEDGEWSWALYPPVFFLHGLRVAQGRPVPDGSAGGTPAPQAGAADDAAESGIYMMQYRDIAALDIIELSARRLALSGLVDFHGRQLPFHIDISRSAQCP